MIFICLTIVLLPLSPLPNKRILHSFLKLRSSSAICLSMAILRSLSGVVGASLAFLDVQLPMVGSTDRVRVVQEAQSV